MWFESKNSFYVNANWSIYDDRECEQNWYDRNYCSKWENIKNPEKWLKHKEPSSKISLLRSKNSFIFTLPRSYMLINNAHKTYFIGNVAPTKEILKIPQAGWNSICHLHEKLVLRGSNRDMMLMLLQPYTSWKNANKNDFVKNEIHSMRY